MIIKALLVTACGATRLIDWIEPGDAVNNRIKTMLIPTARPYYQPPIAAPLPEDTTLGTREFQLADEIRLPTGGRIYVYLELGRFQ